MHRRLEKIDCFRHHYLGTVKYRESAYPGAESRKTQRGQFVPFRELQRALRCGSDVLRIGVQILPHDGRVKNMLRLQRASRGENCAANINGSERYRLPLDIFTTSALDRAGNAGPHPEVIVCRIDNCLGFLLRNITPDDFDAATADDTLHAGLCLPLPDRKPETDCCPSSRFAVNFNRALVVIHDLLHDRHPEPCAVFFPVRHKWLKYHVPDMFRNANAGVTEFDDQVVCLPEYVDGERPPLRHGVNGIVDDIVKHARQLLLVGIDTIVEFHVCLQDNAVPLEVFLKEGERVEHEVGNIEDRHDLARAERLCETLSQSRNGLREADRPLVPPRIRDGQHRHVEALPLQERRPPAREDGAHAGDRGRIQKILPERAGQSRSDREAVLGQPHRRRQHTLARELPVQALRQEKPFHRARHPRGQRALRAHARDRHAGGIQEHGPGGCTRRALAEVHHRGFPIGLPQEQKAAPLTATRTAALTEADELDRLFELEKRLALRIYSALGVELTPAERAAVTKRRTENLQALLAYGRGLQASDAGNYAAALRYFSEATRVDPGFAAARQQAVASRSMLAATRTTTDQLARTATVVTNATAAAQATLTGLLRDPLAEILGNEGATGKSTIELVIRRPGGAE